MWQWNIDGREGPALRTFEKRSTPYNVRSAGRIRFTYTFAAQNRITRQKATAGDGTLIATTYT